MIDKLVVHLDLPGVGPRPVGMLFFTAKAGRLVSVGFRYDAEYLADQGAFSIDPQLPLFAGIQHVAGLPGAMQDCSPDRWGRNLIVKARRSQVTEHGRRLESLTEVDFLIGVSDLTRQGALRFTLDSRPPFLGVGTEVPALVELPRLLRAADAVTRDDEFAAVKELLDAGTGSLGGARPKASVRDGERLYIAKFPHPNDEWDVMAWEAVVLDLAERAGVTVPRRRVTRVQERTVLLLERFDRQGAQRIPYLSAMTLLGARDGDPHDYLEVAEAMVELSVSASADLNELWRRIAFSLAVNNTDDHLRNHGFLRGLGGWRLSPVFDVNANPHVGATRQTGIAGAYTRPEALEALLSVASDFDLTPDAAARVLAEVTSAVATWRDVAARHHLQAREIDRFEESFTP